ncbi:MAG: carbohydrate kinase family protein [Chloroflexi bacterium]|nr:carbohydrate kinase family protein [Chloroflexota bacterium]
MDEYPPVVVVGAAAMDTKGRPDKGLTAGTSCEGDIRISVGGSARNVAENLARLGVPTTLLTAVGKDGSGRRILHQAQESGINVDRVIVTDEYHTAAYMTIYDERGEPVYSIHDMDILSLITPQYLYYNRRVITESALIAVDANLSPRALRSLFALARKHKIRVCADPTTVGLAARLKPYLGELYMVTPNAAEAEALTGVPVTNKARALRAAKALVGMGVRLAIVTLAEKGLCYATSEASGTLPAVPCEIVDLTGAGDALTAAVIFGLLNEMDVDDAVRLGLAAAAATIGCEETVCPDLSVDVLYEKLVV